MIGRATNLLRPDELALSARSGELEQISTGSGSAIPPSLLRVIQ